MAMRITGVDNVLAVLNQLPQEIGAKVVDSAVRQGGNVLRREIQNRAPVVQPESIQTESGGIRRSYLKRKARFGRLRQNIRVSKVKGTVGKFVVHTGRAFWASFLEFGTKHMKKQAFVRPAFDASKERVVKAIAEGLGKGLEGQARSLARRAKRLG